MFVSGFAWFDLIVGVALLIEAAVFSVLRQRPGAGRRGLQGDLLLMLASFGVLLIGGSVARLAGLTGAAMTATFLVAVVSFVAMIVFGTRSLRARRRTAPQPQK
jgi:hypothetical protein